MEDKEFWGCFGNWAYLEIENQQKLPISSPVKIPVTNTR